MRTRPEGGTVAVTHIAIATTAVVATSTASPDVMHITLAFARVGTDRCVEQACTSEVRLLVTRGEVVTLGVVHEVVHEVVTTIVTVPMTVAGR